MIKRLKITILLLLFISFSIFIIKACNNRFNSSLPNISRLDSTDDCRIIYHTIGKTCVPKKPKRLTTISQFTLGNTLVMGVKPIGSASTLNSLKDEFPTYLKNKTQGIKQLGSQYEPNLERMLLLKPDLILGWEAVKKVYPLLSQISLTVLGSWQGMPSWREHFNFVAEVLGKEEALQQAWNHYYQRINELKIALGNRYIDKTISVIFISGGLENRMLSKKSFIGSIFHDIGLKQPKAQNIVTTSGWISGISEEKLEEVDGDILFILTIDNSDSKKNEKLQQKPLWKTLKAVRQRRVYTVNALTWVGSNLLAADAVIDDLFKYLVNVPESLFLK